jgi:lipoprotein-releasing system permease protein
MDGARKRVSAIFIRFDTGVNVDSGCDRVQEMWDDFKASKAGAPDDFLLDTVTVESWKEYRRASIAPMEQEELLLSIMFAFVGMTTVFIVFVVFYMIVNHKTRDIGILKSVGASDGSIMGLFAGFALAVGVLGSLAGTAAALVFLTRINQLEAWLFKTFKWQLWNRAIFAIGEIPHETKLALLAAVAGCAVAACLIGALVPSTIAARLRPVDTLHGSRK